MVQYISNTMESHYNMVQNIEPCYSEILLYYTYTTPIPDIRALSLFLFVQTH